MWLLCASLVLLLSVQSSEAVAWNEAVPGVQPFWEKYDKGPHGFLIRGWNFSRCASEQWNNYPANITNIVISPDKPQFPGPIFFHVTLDVKEDLPRDNIDLDLEIRASFVKRKNGNKQWEIVPCMDWNIEDGCVGYGSCYYCNILETCNKTVIGAFKYVKVQKIFRNTKDSEFVRRNDLCPPPKGQLTMTFSKDISAEDVRQSFLGQRFSSEYFLTFDFNKGWKEKLGCGRLWIDGCKYLLDDKEKKCIKRPIYFDNCFGG